MGDERQLPGEVEGVLEAAIHPVALGGGAEMGGVPRQQDGTRPEPLGDPRVAVEARRVGDVLEADGRQIATERRRRVGGQVGFWRARSQIDAPPPFRKRGQEDRKLVQEGVDRLVGVRPARQGGVEHGPGLRDVTPAQLDSAQLPDGAVGAVAPDHPGGRNVLRRAVVPDGRDKAFLALLQIDELG